MATITVESPGIASAKEEAAAILFAREPQTPLVAPVPPEPIEVTTSAPARPAFAKYHVPEPTYTKPVDTTTFRPYQNFDEVNFVECKRITSMYAERIHGFFQ